MNLKAKGTRAERELLELFWKAGFACLRAPASGSMRHPGPDILAGKINRRLAVECKSTKEIKQYITKNDYEQITEFARIFGAEAWFAVRFDNLKDKWFFLNPEDIKITEGGNFVITLEEAKRKGLLFEEVIK